MHTTAKPLLLSLKAATAVIAGSLALTLTAGTCHATIAPSSSLTAPTITMAGDIESIKTIYPFSYSFVKRVGTMSPDEIRHELSTAGMQSELSSMAGTSEGQERWWPLVVVAGEAILTAVATAGLRTALTVALRGGLAAFETWVKANPVTGAIVTKLGYDMLKDLYTWLKEKILGRADLSPIIAARTGGRS